MTVVAWDGTTLAADRRTTCGGLIRETTKIWRIGKLLVGGAGELGTVCSLRDWVAGGCDPERAPKYDAEPDAELLVIHPDGATYRYYAGVTPFRCESRAKAIGSGAPYAVTAMHLGRSAEEAVHIASELHNGCGNGVDTLRIEA